MRPVRSSAIVLVLALFAASCGGGGGSHGGSRAGGGGSPAPRRAQGPGPQLAPARAKTASVIDREGAGFLEENQGQLLLHVKGTPYEMGRQYGALAGERIERVLAALPTFMATQRFPSWLLPGAVAITAQLFRPYFPGDVLDMIRGIIDGNRARRPASFLSEDDLIFLTSIVDLGGITDGLITCSSIAVWGPHTAGGKMFQTRNVDLFTGSGIEDAALAVIEKRDGKTPFINCGWAGMLGAISGLNAHGVGIGQIWAFSQDRAFGVPWGLTTRRIMEDAVNADDAVRIFTSEPHRTYGANFVFGDKGDGRGGVPRAYAVESSASRYAVFADNDPAEDRAIVQTANGPECYAIKIPSAVFRGDCALDPTMRAFQTASNGPAGDPRTASAYQRRYKGQADSLARLEQGGAKVGAKELIELTKDVAMTGSSLQCCVYANSDLQVWVANATLSNGAGKDASTQPYVRHDFDYYLPTVRIALDKAVYAAGEMQQVSIEWETLGSDRDLALALSIEGPGGQHFYPALGAPLPLSFRQGAPTQSRALSLALPPVMNAGSYDVVARLYERGTADLVDVALARFDLR
jgi:hypothetical protein